MIKLEIPYKESSLIYTRQMLECSYQETQRYGSGTYGLSNKTYCNDQCTMLLSPSFIIGMFQKTKINLLLQQKSMSFFLILDNLQIFLRIHHFLSLLMSRNSVAQREQLKRKKKAAKDVIISRSASTISLNCS